MAARVYSNSIWKEGYQEFDIQGTLLLNELGANTTETFECSKMARVRELMVCTQDVLMKWDWNYDKDEGVLVQGNRL